MSRTTLTALGVLGWILFGASIWWEHRPAELPKPETIEQLRTEGFTPATTSALPPPKVLRETVKIPGAERIVYVQVHDEPTEKTPPSVRSVPGNCLTGAAQAPNWALLPGHLGLRGGELDIRRAGREAFVLFKGTIVAQTPAGEVTRVIKPETDAWVSTRALGLPPRFGPTVRASTLPSFEAGVYWTKGRAQYEATAGYDFDRSRFFAAGGVRF